MLTLRAQGDWQEQEEEVVVLVMLAIGIDVDLGGEEKTTQDCDLH